MTNTEPNNDAAALGNLRYTFDSVAELDRECGSRTGVAIFPYCVGEHVYGYELKITSAFPDAASNLELLDSTTYAEAINLQELAEILSEGIDPHFKALKARVAASAQGGAERTTGR